MATEMENPRDFDHQQHVPVVDRGIETSSAFTAMGDEEKERTRRSSLLSEKGIEGDDGIGKELGEGEVNKDGGVDGGKKKEKTEEEEEYVYVTGFKFALVYMGITLTAFLMLLDTSIVTTAIPHITSQFHSLQDVGWYGASYLLANACLQPLTGKVYTYFSSKYSFLGFLFIFELGSLLCGVATSSKMLIVGRAVAGLGTSGLFNGAITILAASIPMNKRPLYTGLLMSGAQIGILLGPLIGGALTQYTTWRWCFYINLPAGGLVAILLLLITIPDRRKHTTAPWYRTVFTEFDLMGFFLFAPAMIQLLLAVQWGGVTYSWSSAKIIGLFCGAAATLALFIYWEHRTGFVAMIPLSMISQRVVWSSCLAIFFFFGNLMTNTYYLPIYFQTVKGKSPTLSGVYLLPSILPQILGAISSGILVTRVGFYLPFVLVAGVLVSIGSGLLSTLSVSSSTGKWVGYQIIVGFGRGLGLQMPIVAVQNHLPPTQTPVAMALIIFSQTLGGALFLSFDQTLFSSELKTALRHFVPGLDPQTVIDAGATAVRGVVSPEVLPGVIKAYARSIDRVFYLAAGMGVAFWVVGWGLGWKYIRKKEGKGKKGEGGC